MGVDAVLSELQSIQTRVTAQRKKLDSDNPWAQVPAVCADVVQYLMQERPVSAFKSMLLVVEALPAYAFGNTDGAVAREREASMLKMVIAMLMDETRAVDVPQSVATGVLSGLKVGISAKTSEVEANNDPSEPADASGSRPRGAVPDACRGQPRLARAPSMRWSFWMSTPKPIPLRSKRTLLGERLAAAPRWQSIPRRTSACSSTAPFALQAARRFLHA